MGNYVKKRLIPLEKDLHLRIEEHTYNYLYFLAQKKNITVAELVRNYIVQSIWTDKDRGF